jgi:hypothetical protein
MGTVVMLPSEICAANSSPYCGHNVISHYCVEAETTKRVVGRGCLGMRHAIKHVDIERKKNEVYMLL